MTSRLGAWQAGVLLLLVSCSQPGGVPEATELALSSLCGDGMVLQRETTAALLGRTSPHARVRVLGSWPGATPTAAVADATGRFVARVATGKAGGPFELEVTAGARRIVVRDVLLGEVWLGSGQSNMEMPVGDVGTGFPGVVKWQEELLAASDPQIRLFTVKRAAVVERAPDVEGSWQAATPESVKAFSAVGWFFAKKLRAELGVPVGFVASHWGGTPVEAWTGPDALVAQGDFTKALDEVARQNAERAQIARRRAAWWRTQEAKRADFLAQDAATGVALPHVWGREGLGAHDGLGWYVCEFEVPAGLAGRELELLLGPIDDLDVAWWDDTRVGATTEPGHWFEPRRYPVAANLATPGKHRIVVLAFDTGGEGGLGGTTASYGVRLRSGTQEVPLGTGWRFARGAELKELPPYPAQAAIGGWTPAALWHGMIEPLVPFAFRGVLWYQGESNRGRAAQYRQLFPAMIQDWRRHWERELPFYFVQIAPFAYPSDKGEAAELREAQCAALALPRTGMAVTLDVGDAKDIHPREKRVVGERLALHALRAEYGRTDLLPSAPAFAKLVRTGTTLEVHFAAGAGSLDPGAAGGVRGFEIAGADGIHRPATATVTGDLVVVVTAPEVREPVSVRYAWSAVPVADLRSATGLPVAPFRAALR